jgi:uncharacterized protein with NRDE domain
MCTVVLRWQPGEPTRLLALRDELTDRAFDDPGEWWPQHPGVVGGRDRAAGGTWCASKVATGVTALVLNRPEKRVATPGAPSRGVLPLLGVSYGHDWPEHVELTGMASFALVLAAPQQLTVWAFDGNTLTCSAPGQGTHMVTSGGAEDGKADRFLAAFERAAFPDDWRELVQSDAPQDSPAALVVRHEFGDRVYATVFGQLIEAQSMSLHLEHTRTPWLSDSWSTTDY